MKINYIKLKNFLGIYAGMNRTCIEIDFKNNKNKIIILNAGNGKGKTTLLSMLHPLRETFDNRKDIVIPNQLGEKIIDLENNGNFYHIEHFYGKKNKSFISKNNIELNENGNIKSFNQIAKEELGINGDYFKLGRIGSNVSNFIDLKASDRKKYITDFIPSIDEYLKAFDIVKSKYTTYNSQIKFIKNTIEKYSNLRELDDIKNYITELENNLNNYNNNLIDIKSKIKNYNNDAKKYIDNIINYINENTEDYTITDINKLSEITLDIDNRIYDIELKVNKYTKERNDYIDKYKIYTDKDITEYIDSLKIKFNERKIKMDEKINSLLNGIEKMNNDKIEIMNNIQYYNNKINSLKIDKNDNMDIEELEKQFNITNDEIVVTNDRLMDYSTLFPKDILNDLIDYYQEHNFIDGSAIIEDYDILSESYDIEYLKKYYENRNKNINIKSLKNNKVEIENELEIINKNLNELIGKLNYVDEVLPKRPNTCKDNTCSFVKTALDIQQNDVPKYNDLLNKKEILENKLTELDNQIVEYETDLSLTNELKIINNKVKLLMHPYFANTILNKNILIEPHSTLLEDMNIFVFKKILDCNKTINELTEYKDKLENKINNKKITNKLYKEYEEQLTLFNEKLTNINDKINEMNNELNEYKDKYNDTLKRLSICEDYYIINTNYETYLKEYNKYHKIQLDLFKLITEFKNFNNTNNISILKDNENLLNNNIKEIETKLNENRTAVTIIEDNMKKLSELEEIFSNVVLIKDALDPKKGIPVVFANEYLKNIANNTNKLLNIAYDNKFMIRFNVTSTDFLVEVYKDDGTMLSDINDASQGEVSFTNISLSLAMLESMIKKYNIIYLDECDSTLSTKNRRLFIELLENQMDILNIEQCFVITHNNEFYDKNVDLILLEDHDCPIDDKDFMEGKNIIFKL